MYNSAENFVPIPNSYSLLILGDIHGFPEGKLSSPSVLSVWFAHHIHTKCLLYLRMFWLVAMYTVMNEMNLVNS